MLKYIVGSVLGLGVIGAAAMPSEPDSYSKEGHTMEQVAPAKKKGDKPAPLWKSHMNEVHIGMTESEVKAILGKPNDTDSTEMGEVMDEGTTTMDNWTYGEVLEDHTLWMLSFTNGKLDSKSRM